jgi:hypothetical protein
MAFMELYTTDKTDWYAIDGNEGVTFVETSIVGEEDTSNLDAFKDYYEGAEVREVRILRQHYGAHYSASGYMDQTPWMVGRNLRQLVKEVRDLYGE